MTNKQAQAAWKILVKYGGVSPANDYMRSQFELYVTQDDWLEFRFGGSLGFGGKFYAGNPPVVRMYPEDETPARLKAAAEANKAIAELFTDKGNDDE